MYKTPRYRGTSFTVVHYAGAVQYSLEGVLEKNRDTLRHSLAFVMRSECRERTLCCLCVAVSLVAPTVGVTLWPSS